MKSPQDNYMKGLSLPSCQVGMGLNVFPLLLLQRVISRTLPRVNRPCFVTLVSTLAILAYKILLLMHIPHVLFKVERRSVSLLNALGHHTQGSMISPPSANPTWLAQTSHWNDFLCLRRCALQQARSHSLAISKSQPELGLRRELLITLITHMILHPRMHARVVRELGLIIKEPTTVAPPVLQPSEPHTHPARAIPADHNPLR